MKKACDLLQQGKVLNQLYQPHEGHLPFILQFMIDYNLHGMNFVSFSQVLQRIDSRTSVCELEVDASAENILNRLEIKTGKVTTNLGIAALWNDELERRRNKGEHSELAAFLTQSRVSVSPTLTHNLYKAALKENLRRKVECDPSKPSLNSSLYAIETPPSQKGVMCNASILASHLSQPESHQLESTLDASDISNVSGLNDSFSATLANSDAKQLLEILQDLGNNIEDGVEEDSILSQTSIFKDDYDDHDLSMPFEAVAILENKDKGVSRLDGAGDSDLEESPTPFKKGCSVKASK